MVFPPKRENVHLDAVEDNVALIYPIGSLWHWFGAFCVAKNGTKTGGQRDIEVRLKGDMYKIHSLEYSHLYIKLSLNTCRWVGLCDEKGGYTN